MNEPRTLEALRTAVLGRWVSISTELRPAEDRTGEGSVKPTYLKRDFTYLGDDRFLGVIRLFADGYGEHPLLEFEFRGHLRWGGAHPVAPGAFVVDYVLDEGFAVTPLNDAAAAMLNAGAPAGSGGFAPNEKTDILGRAFPLFAISEGQVVVDHDLLLLEGGMLFFGAKHVDGTPFDRPDRRPHQLQVPLVRG